MSCNGDRDDYAPIRLAAWRDEHKPPPVIALLHKLSGIAVVPVRWFPNYAVECDSWWFDKRTWDAAIAAAEISIVHFHRRPAKGMKSGQHMVYRIAVDTFSHAAHSSFECTDPDREHSERMHVPRPYFGYDADQEEEPAPEPMQVALL